VQDLAPIEITSWCRCLANLGEKRNLPYILYFLHPCSKKRSCATEFPWLFHNLCQLTIYVAARQHVDLLPHIHLAMARVKYKLQNSVANHKIGYGKKL